MNNARYILRLVFFTLALSVFFASCSEKALQDGTFKGLSLKDEQGARGEIVITVKNQKITHCVYVTRQKDGSIKDENYGKLSGKTDNSQFYQKAQNAVSAMSAYAEELVKKGSPQAVDVISGATISYKQFQEAAADAIHQSQNADKN